MGMRLLLTFWFLLLTFTIRAANPAYTDFRGTNQVVVATNVTTGRIIIGPATPISTTASNAAMSLMVWTNDGTFMFPSGTVPSNTAPFVIRKDGSIFQGTNAALDVDMTAMSVLRWPWIVSLSDSNQASSVQRQTAVINNEDDYSDYAYEALTLKNTDSGDPIANYQITLSSKGSFIINITHEERYIDFLGKWRVSSNGTWKANGNGTNVGTFYSQSDISAPTNIASFGFVTTNLLSGQTYTNFTQRGHVVATVQMTNVLAGDVSSMALIVDQNGDGTWDTTNGPVRINGVALSAGEEQLFGLLQPGARFAYTNQSSGASPSVAIRAGSCQWSRW